MVNNIFMFSLELNTFYFGDDMTAFSLSLSRKGGRERVGNRKGEREIILRNCGGLVNPEYPEQVSIPVRTTH